MGARRVAQAEFDEPTHYGVEVSYSDKISRNFEPYREPDETVVTAFPAMTKNQFWHMLPLTFWIVFSNLSSNDALGSPRLLEAFTGLVCVIPVVLFLRTNKNLTIIATDRRTVIGRSEFWSATKVVSIEQILPAELDLGAPSGFFYKTDVVGEQVRIHWRAFKDVRIANSRNR